MPLPTAHLGSRHLREGQADGDVREVPEVLDVLAHRGVRGGVDAEAPGPRAVA